MADPLRLESFDVDPGWASLGSGGNGNDFGYRTTANAGRSPGEAGGTFTRAAMRTETVN